MEPFRIVMLRISIVVGYIIAIMIGVFCVWGTFTYMPFDDKGIIFIAILALSFYVPLRFVRSLLHNRFNEEFLKWVYESVYLQYVDIYANSGRIRKGIQSTADDEIFPFDSRNCENYIRGSYNRTDFELYDTRSITHEWVGRYRMKETLFVGTWITMGFSRETSRILVKERGLNPKLKHVPRFMEKYVVNSVEFADKFEVFCENENDAKNILSTEFVEKILELKKFVTTKIVIGIVGDKISIVIENANCDLWPRLFFRISDKELEEVEENLKLKLKVIDIVSAL